MASGSGDAWESGPPYVSRARPGDVRHGETCVPSWRDTMSPTSTSGRPLAEGLLAFAVLSALPFAVA